jgi:hypothetical protein
MQEYMSFQLPREAHFCTEPVFDYLYTLWSPGIDSEESIPPASVAWRAGTTNRVVVPARQAGNRFLVYKYRLRAQDPKTLSQVESICLSESSILRSLNNLR